MRFFTFAAQTAALLRARVFQLRINNGPAWGVCPCRQAPPISAQILPHVVSLFTTGQERTRGNPGADPKPRRSCLSAVTFNGVTNLMNAALQDLLEIHIMLMYVTSSG